MPDAKNPRPGQRPNRPNTRGAGVPSGPNEHDPFVIDTRRKKGNRRAAPMPQRSQGQQRDDGVQAMPTRGHDETTAMSGGQRPVADAPTQAMRPGDQGAAYRGAGRGPGGPVSPGGPRGPHDPRRPGGPTGPAGPGGQGTPSSERRRGRHRGRKILAGLLVLVLLWCIGIIWAGTSAWNKVDKVDAMPSEHLAPKGDGENILLVGSDGRGGLTNEQKRRLGTGSADGQRTDSIMVLHIGGGKPTLMSIPRDSYVDIPGHNKNKINASFSIGGPKLLIQTVEKSTGIHIDHYMEIGFAGFAGVVDQVGGVDICVKFDMDDPKAHINLKKGCQKMDGPTALGYVRARYSDPEGDLGRAKRQRQFLGALMKKISSPTNLIFPWELKGLGESGAQGLAVDKSMGMFTTANVMWNLKKLSGNGGNSVMVPVGDTAYQTAAGEAVLWDKEAAAKLFDAINHNKDTSPWVKKG